MTTPETRTNAYGQPVERAEVGPNGDHFYIARVVIYEDASDAVSASSATHGLPQTARGSADNGDHLIDIGGTEIAQGVFRGESNGKPWVVMLVSSIDVRG